MDVRIGNTRTGLGLFAARTFAPGECIVEYVGDYISNDEALRRKENRYLFEIDNRETIDGTTRKNIARYVNHSCMPNAEVRIYQRRVYVYAQDRIEAGTEITFNYGIEYFNDFIKPVGCKCDSPVHIDAKPLQTG